jgi:PAS domain S-box-containing protein
MNSDVFGVCMKKSLCIITLLLLEILLTAGTSSTDPTVIRVGSYENPPKIYTDANGNTIGFWADVLSDIARQENWKIIWVKCDWQDCLQKLENNEIDIMPDVGWSSDRNKIYLFNSVPVLISWARVYEPPNSKIETILDLDGKKIAGLTGSLHFDGPEGIKAISKNFGVTSTYLEKSSYDEVLQSVAQGEAEAGITNKDYGDINERRFGVKRTPIILQPTQIMFAFPKNNPNSSLLAKVLDNHINKYQDDASSIYYLSMDKYLGQQSSGTVQVIPNWLRTVLLVGAGGIFILVAAIFITREQVRARTRQLSSSEARYRALISNLPDMIFRINKNGEVIDFHTAENTLLISPVTILRRNITEVLPGDVGEAVLEKIASALKSNELQRNEFRLKMRDEWHDFEARYKSSGEQEVVTIVRDITIQKRAQLELRQSEERYQTLAHVSPVGIFYADAQGETTFVNPTWCEIAGIPPEKALGNGWLDAIHPDDKENLYANWEMAAQNGLQSTADYRFIRADGSIVWVIGQAMPEKDDEGRVVGYVGTITNITERKKVEIALQQSIKAEREALRISRVIQAANLTLSRSLDLSQILDSLLTHLALLVPYDAASLMLLDDNRYLIPFLSRDQHSGEQKTPEQKPFNPHENRAIQSILDSGKSMIQADVSALPEWPYPPDLPLGKSWMGVPLLAGGQVLGLYMLTKDGSNSLFVEDQELAEALAAQAALAIQNAKLHEALSEHAHELEIRVADRTAELANRVQEVEQLNESMQVLMDDLKIALQKAESADRLKSAFLATMSHELRTPLNSIIGFSGILLQKLVGPLSPEQEKQLRMVQNSAQHLLELINDVLDISKIEADQMIIASLPFQVEAAIQQCLDRSQTLIGQKEIRLESSIHPPQISIISDRRRFEQILLNLVNNAIKFTEKGEVRVDCSIEKDWVITSISDTGIGIKEEDLVTLFKPFHQVDTGITRQYEGTGLGLSICKRLVELMGGSITVESKPGAGSKFTFQLPYPGGNNE